MRMWRSGYEHVGKSEMPQRRHVTSFVKFWARNWNNMIDIDIFGIDGGVVAPDPKTLLVKLEVAYLTYFTHLVFV